MYVVGSWNLLDQRLSESLSQVAVASYGGYVYVIGGTPAFLWNAGNGTVHRIDSLGRVEEMPSMQLPYGLYDATVIVVDNVMYCFGGEMDEGITSSNSWLKWTFPSEAPTEAGTTTATLSPTPTTDSSTNGPTVGSSSEPSSHISSAPTTLSPTTSSTDNDSGASEMTETPKAMVISVAVILGLWICGILTCLLLRCRETALRETEDVHYLAQLNDSNQPGVAQQRNKQYPPNRGPNHYGQAPVMTPGTPEGMATAGSEGMETEGQSTGTTPYGGRLTAIVDAEEMKLNQWIAEQEQNDREAVRKWLEIKGFGQYFELFVNNGFAKMRDIERIQSHEQLEQIGIADFEERMKLIAAIRSVK